MAKASTIKRATKKSVKKRATAKQKMSARAKAKPARKSAAKKSSARKVPAGLELYKKKRDFRRTAEPEGKVVRRSGNFYCVQKHDASHLHYDLRLELDGVLKSWAVPKGPSLNPRDKRLAIHVEDHPLEYGTFEGTIPKGEYGGGTVMLWDVGTWEPLEDARADYREGRLKFQLFGEKLRGGWMLVRKGGRSAAMDEKTWFLIKERDEYARDDSGESILDEQPLSAKTGRDLDQIAAGAPARKKLAATRVKKNVVKVPRDATSRSAPAAALPRTIQPQLATLVKSPPVGEQWLHEIKLDGYRMLCRVERGRAQFISRSNQDWSGRFGLLVTAIEKLPVRSAIFDGEVVVLEPDGTTSFQALQNMLSDHHSRDLVYFVFDLLYLNGKDLTRLPLAERKEILKTVIKHTDRGPVRYLEHIVGHGPEFFEQACKAKLEGSISKRADQPYRPGRSDCWVKSKCGHQDEFVIIGFTDPSGARTGFGALVLGYYDSDGQLVYAGKVGTGFNEKTLVDLDRRLRQLEQPKTPLDKRPPKSLGRGVHWVRPELVAQVHFAQWTNDGILRQPSFQGLREDKPASQVRRETPITINGKSPKRAARRSAAPTAKHFAATKPRPSAARRSNDKPARGKPADAPSASRARSVSRAKDEGAVVAGVRITHPERIVYPEQGLSKLAIAQYFERVADWILPHVLDRPLTLVRCPEGSQKKCFYQKHAMLGVPEALGHVAVREKYKTGQYLVVKDLRGLVSLVQFGVLEIHVWGAKADDIERPDRLVFDLDPDPEVKWSRVIEAARVLRHALEELGLKSFVKTTGGKGLHLVIPIRRRETWDEAKAFCGTIAEALVQAAPDQFTANMSKAARRGKIFVDYLRNDRGATWVAPYSTRAKQDAPVSTPLDWKELREDIGPAFYNTQNVVARLKSLKRDPWEDIFRVRQGLTAKIKRAVGL